MVYGKGLIQNVCKYFIIVLQFYHNELEIISILQKKQHYFFFQHHSFIHLFFTNKKKISFQLKKNIPFPLIHTMKAQ